MSDEDIADRIRLRVAETGADLVILPERFDDQTGKGVYAEDTLLLVKRLKQEGVKADYLDASSDRLFVTQKSALLVLAGTFAIGVASGAGWDGLKKLVSLVRGKSDDDLTIKVTNASDSTPSELTVTGSPATVIDAFEQLKARGHIDPDTAVPRLDHDPPREAAGITTGPPSAHALKQIERSLKAGKDLLDRSRQVLANGPADVVAAEKLARQALPHFRSALDWAEDTDREYEAHAAMDAAGHWTCETFGCELEYTDGNYYRTCPVDLGHNRVGFSVGGVATRVCSLCDLDFSECEHDPTREYLIPGGTGPHGYCRICMEKDCTEHQPHLQYRARPGSIVTEMQLDEVSLVARPAQPDARIQRQSVSISQLAESLGEGFTPGMTVTCERCLGDCGGLIQFKGPKETA